MKANLKSSLLITAILSCSLSCKENKQNTNSTVSAISLPSFGLCDKAKERLKNRTDLKAVLFAEFFKGSLPANKTAPSSFLLLVALESSMTVESVAKQLALIENGVISENAQKKLMNEILLGQKEIIREGGKIRAVEFQASLNKESIGIEAMLERFKNNLINSDQQTKKLAVEALEKMSTSVTKFNTGSQSQLEHRLLRQFAKAIQGSITNGTQLKTKATLIQLEIEVNQAKNSKAIAKINRSLGSVLKTIASTQNPIVKEAFAKRLVSISLQSSEAVQESISKTLVKLNLNTKDVELLKVTEVAKQIVQLSEQLGKEKSKPLILELAKRITVNKAFNTKTNAYIAKIGSNRPTIEIIKASQNIIRQYNKQKRYMYRRYR